MTNKLRVEDLFVSVVVFKNLRLDDYNMRPLVYNADVEHHCVCEAR